MKTITLFILVLFMLNGIFLFAANTDTRSSSSSIKSAVTEASYLSPVTPVVADFENAATSIFEPVDVMALAPITPMEATFEENTGAGSGLYVKNLSPVVPAEADFNDLPDNGTDAGLLAPSTPGVAGFEY